MFGYAIGIEAWITRELQAGRRERINGRVSSRCIGAGKKLPCGPAFSCHGRKRFVTHAVDQGEPPSHLPVVLTIEALEVAAQIQKLARGLGKILYVPNRKLAMALFVIFALNVKRPGC